jgi:pseudouridine-5'-phosphate glycosidase
VGAGVAEKVAGMLKGTLMPEEAARVARVPTQNREACDLYLRALAFSRRANDRHALTPFLRAELARVTDGASVRANRALALNNVRVGAQLARAWSRLADD